MKKQKNKNIFSTCIYNHPSSLKYSENIIHEFENHRRNAMIKENYVHLIYNISPNDLFYIHRAFS